MSVEDWRGKIDEIDRRLVELLNERSRCVVEIGRIKQVSSGEALYQPDREKQVLDGVVARIPGRFRTPRFAACSNESWMKRDRSSAW
jgi:chorismate mutase/prephenate dehydratase